MKLLIVALLAGLLLSGCSVPGGVETVMDSYDIPVSNINREVTLTLPEGTAQAVMESGTGGSLYVCDGFLVSVCTLPGGDMKRSVKTVTGFDESALTVMQTLQDGYKRYDLAWSAMGEGKSQTCKAVILDDGEAHYAVTAMCDYEKAGVLNDKISEVLDSVMLTNTD